MGNLLGAPVTEKETHRGCTPEGLAWGVSSMQGWRIHMEDAHICQPFLYAEERIAKKDDDGGGDGGDNNDDAKMNDEADGGAATKPKFIKIPVPGHSLFAVYDGHGGSFAAEYSGMNFCRVLARQVKFVKYAKMFREESERKKKEEEEKKGGEEDDDAEGAKSENPGPSDGDGEGEEKESEEEQKRKREAAAIEMKKQRDLLNLLEEALRDAFIEVDREILREMRRLPNEDANTPYGEDFEEHHSHGEIHKKGSDEEGEGGEAGGDGANKAKEENNSNNNDGKPRLTSEDEDSGTTAIVVVLTPKYIVCANAGDSRAVYSKSKGRAVPLSYDHKPDDEEEERRIRDAGGYVSAGRVEGDLAVSRGLGDFRFKDSDSVLAGLDAGDREGAKDDEDGGGGGGNPGRNRAMVRPDDQMVSPVPDVIVQSRNPKEDEFVVVACDGIWDVQTNLECVRTVAEIFQEGEDDVGLLAEEVLDVCLRRGSKDNMTALVVRLEAQETGEGGGVAARRELREVAAREAEEGQNSGGEGGGGGGGGGGSGGDNEGEKRKRDEFFSGSPGYS